MVTHAALFFGTTADDPSNFPRTVKFTPELSALPQPQQLPGRLGFDLAQVSAIDESLQCFGERFAQRLFTTHELAYADGGRVVRAQRLAARFAAKEAVIKALGLSEAGVDWREIEVVKLSGGSCAISLHGRVAQLASAMGAGPVSLSLSHEGDYAGAVVTVPLSTQSLREHTST
jgi:holo-[acyl-carrier protein] synthase